jgi:hypothetical protein
MGWLIASTIIGASALIGSWVGGAIKNSQGLKNEKSGAENNYKSALYNANEALKSAKNYYNQTKTTITNKYGSDVFRVLEQQYNSVNEITKNSATNGGKVNLYDTDTLKDVSIDFDYDYENHSFSYSNLKNDTIDNLYNLLSSGDTALAQELRLSGNQISSMLGQAQDEVNQTFDSYTSQIKQYGEQYRSQKISDTESIASARSTMAYSGIRNTGTGNASENLTRLQADITEATLAFQIQSYATQLQSKIDSLQTSASISAYQNRASLEISKRQALESAIETHGSGMNLAEKDQNTARINVEDAQEYKKQYADYEKVGWWEEITGQY